jgi:mitogen-activated protein kinase kinase
MLLQHAWLAPLIKPATITEEDEEEAESEAAAASEPAPTDAANGLSPQPAEVVYDKEVADWVKDALEKRKKGILGKGAPKPALHAAPWDAVSSPGKNGSASMDFAVQAS